MISIKNRSLKIFIIYLLFLLNYQIQSMQYETSIQEMNLDGTFTVTTYHNNKTKTINYFDEYGKNNLRIEFDAQGNPIKSIHFNSDGTQTITTHHPDKTQTADHRDRQGQIISKTHTNNIGYKTTADTKLLTAWHEAGHALSYIRNHEASLVHCVTIRPDEATKTNGHVKSIHAHDSNQTIYDFEKHIISALCGGAAEQVAMNQKIFIHPHEILQFFSQPQYCTDMQIAYSYAREIVVIQNFQHLNEKQIQQKINEIIIRLYKQAYSFIFNNKHDVKKIALALLEKEILTSQEVYNILKTDKPFINYIE
ncbi:MAG: hypothetical protein JO129_01830 [Candidatus Dependentiae bacterium]|nr:hypothetical protein [Candidatus Dependentiae bacterium]